MNEILASHPRPEQLQDYSLGRLAEPEASAVESHVSACSACCQQLQRSGEDSFVQNLRRSHAALGPADPVSSGGSQEENNFERTLAEPGVTPGANEADSTQGEALRPGPMEAGITQGFVDTAPGEDTGIPEALATHPRYRVLALLGRGGMGAVYKAQHTLMERTVALKVIGKELTVKPTFVERFRREVKAAARLSHPNIVAAHDAEQAGNLHFLVMEFVPGTDLANLVKEQGPLPVAEACEYICQAALGLQHAFEFGMIHRDVKPHNLMRTPQGQIKILDFGLALFAQETVAPLGMVVATSASTPDLTACGAIMGTPDYIAPEQAQDPHSADIRADIYSLGCTLYQLLSGRVPFPEGTVIDKLKSHASTMPVSLRELRPEVPSALEELVMKMLAKAPKDRYQTPAAVADALVPFTTRFHAESKTYADDLLSRFVTRDPRQPTGGIPDQSTRLKPTAPVCRARRRWPMWAALALAVPLLGAGLIYLAATVIRVQTDFGTLEITSDDPDIQVLIKQNGKTIEILDVKRDRKVELRAGAYDIKLTEAGKDLTLSTDHFTIKRGEAAIVRVRRVAAPGPVETQAGQIRTLEGHQGWGIRSISFASRETALSSDAAGNVILWDLKTGKEIRRLIGHQGEVCGVAVSTDGRRAATCGVDNTARLWDLQSGKELRLYGSAQTGGVEGIAISPDGRQLIVSGGDGIIDVWEVETGKKLRTLEGHVGAIRRVAFSPDGKVVLSGGRDTTVRLWDAETGKETRRLEGHTEFITDVAFSPDGRRVASASIDKTARVWDVVSGKEVHRLVHDDALGGAVAFSADGRFILTGGNDKMVRVWDASSGKELHREGHTGGIAAVAISSDSRLVLSGGDLILRLWRLPPPGEVRAFLGHEGSARAVSLSADGQRAISCSGPPRTDLTLRLWDVATGKQIRSFEGHTKQIDAVVLSPDGRLAISSSEDQTVRVWDVAGGKELRRLPGDLGWVVTLAFSKDGKRLLTGSGDRTMNLWDVEANKKLRSFSGHQDKVQCVAFSPDERRALSASHDGSVRLWDLQTGQEIANLTGHDRAAHAVAFCPDGKRALSGGLDNTVRLWDLGMKKELRSLNGHTGPVLGVAVLPDGRRALSCGVDKTVRLWDLEEGKELHCFSGHAAPVWSVVVSADGRQALTACEDGTVRLWPLPQLPPAR